MTDNATVKQPAEAEQTLKSVEKGIPEKYFNFLGLVIVRKADLLAATAFLLAVVSSSYQAGSYLAGARIAIVAPDNVTIFFDKYADGRISTRFLGQLTFVNTGATGRTGTIRESWLDVAGAGDVMRQYWVSFPKISRDGEQLNIQQVDDALPLPVPGEGTTSKLTGFAPRVENCDEVKPCREDRQYVSDREFLKRLAPHMGEYLTITFQARTFQDQEVQPASCRVHITESLLTVLASNYWYRVRCAPVEPESHFWPRLFGR